MLIQSNQSPFHFRRQITEHSLVCRVNPQRRRNKMQPGRRIRQLNSRKIPMAAECVPSASLGIVALELAHAQPIIQPLQRQMQVLIRLQLDHQQPSTAIDSEQIEHPSVARRKRRHLRINALRNNPRLDLQQFLAKHRLQPSLRLQPIERVSSCCPADVAPPAAAQPAR